MNYLKSNLKVGFVFTLMLFGFSAQALNVVNAGNDFKSFLKNFDSSQTEKNLMHWSEFEDKYSDIYTSVIFKRNLPNWDQNKRNQLGKFFLKLPALTPGMLSLFDSADEIAKNQIARIKTQIKDFNTNITVYFLPSVLSFNAIVTGTSADISHYILVVGVDGVSLWNSDLDVLFSHEFFHMYHFDKAGIRADFSSSLTPLWKEGMATYFSKLHNPSKSLDAILMDAELARSCQSAEDLRQLAKAFSMYVGQSLTVEQQNDLTKEWFWTDSKTLPHRRGYCLGYRLVERLTKRFTFEEMILWGDMTFSEELGKELKQMAQ